MKSQLEKNTSNNKNTLALEQGQKRKSYSNPTLTKIGLIHEITLAGGVEPLVDSGTPFSPAAS